MILSLKKFMSKTLSFIKICAIPCKQNNFRPKCLETKSLFFYLIFLTLIYFSFTNIIPSTSYFSTITKNLIFELTNKTRVEYNLNPLKYSLKLEEASKLKAEDMLKNNYFNHYSPTGISPWYWFDKVGYKYSYAGENLAMGFIDAETLHNAWLNSPLHKANILNKNYTEFGTAIVKGVINGKETTIVVELFAKPAIQKKLVNNLKTSLNKKNPITSNAAPSSTRPIQSPTSTLTPESTPTLSGELLEDKNNLLNDEKEKEEQNALEKYIDFQSQELTGKMMLSSNLRNGSILGNVNKILIIIFIGFLTFLFSMLLINIFVEFKNQHTDIILESAVLIFLILLALVLNAQNHTIELSIIQTI